MALNSKNVNGCNRYNENVMIVIQVRIPSIGIISRNVKYFPYFFGIISLTGKSPKNFNTVSVSPKITILIVGFIFLFSLNFGSNKNHLKRTEPFKDSGKLDEIQHDLMRLYLKLFDFVYKISNILLFNRFELIKLCNFGAGAITLANSHDTISKNTKKHF